MRMAGRVQDAMPPYKHRMDMLAPHQSDAKALGRWRRLAGPRLRPQSLIPQRPRCMHVCSETWAQADAPRATPSCEMGQRYCTLEGQPDAGDLTPVSTVPGDWPPVLPS